MFTRAWPTRVVAVLVLVAAPLLGAGRAVAAEGHYRYSHGEPLNDLRRTPGAILTTSAAVVCQSGYATRVRHVSESEKYLVYAEYGITHHRTNQYEIDHLISLELGGSNSLANLWPELNDHPDGYLNSKDQLENRLHELVCSGALALRSAQAQIAANWVTTYHRYLGVWPHALANVTTSSTIQPSTPTTSSGHGVRIVSVITSVTPGESELLRAHSSRPDDACTLDVTLPSGRRSTSSGLGAATANARGDVSWTWRIGTRTGGGTATATVTCRAGVVLGTFVVT